MNHPVLQQTIAERILTRLDFIKLAPERILNLNDSFLDERLSEKYPLAEIVSAIAADIDLAVSNFAIHDDLETEFPKIADALKPDGVFLFTILGVDSLVEIKRPDVQFPDMHNIGDYLLKAGFKDPVMDMEKLAFTYDDTSKIAPDMQGTGLETLLGEYQGSALENGLYPVTFEIIYGLAFKASNEVRIPVDAITKRR